eukprot:PhM_4_TR6166/c0_g1_i1/m.104919/K00850/pfkA, PFK; 6-phosphofructokinase 1
MDRVTSQDPELSVASLTQQNFEVERLPIQSTRYPNPLAKSKTSWNKDGIFVPDNSYMLANPMADFVDGKAVPKMSFLMRRAGPHMDLHHDPKKTVVGIVTCGGLCPGLNNVIRGLTLTALQAYRVEKVVGFRFGFWGLSAKGKHTAMNLSYDNVARIHNQGGTFLGSSRGPQKIDEMVDTLVEMGINVLFTIGGDGTQRGSVRIGEAARKRGLDISVIGIPKTIDNDISFSHRTFGFETAVEQAVLAIRAAHSEASSHQYGVGLVKVMGRHSGFIAAQATVASQQAHICLIPECPVSEEVFLNLLEARFQEAQNVVIVVAEGFGQDWSDGTNNSGTDASGNKRLIDIGTVMKKKIEAFMKKQERFSISTVKYIDPSYIIRACPPNASDAAFCSQLSMLAMHEAMFGMTNALILSWYDHFTVVPIKLATSIRKVVDLRGRLWRAVREVTVDIHTDPKAYERSRVDQKIEFFKKEINRLEGYKSKI